MKLKTKISKQVEEYFSTLIQKMDMRMILIHYIYVHFIEP